MRTRTLTEAERTAITAALLVAVDTYRTHAANPQAIQHGLASQFNQQADDAASLLDLLENASEIVIVLSL